MIKYASRDPLYNAIMNADDSAHSRLKQNGAAISDEAKSVLSINRLSALQDEQALGEITCDFQCAVRRMNAKDFIKTIRALREEIGEPLFFMPALWQDIKKIMFEDGVLECVLDCFDNKMNKARTMRDIIKRGRVDLLMICAEHGWLSQPKKRDELIAYAAKEEKTECTAWLLDFKNRTADLAAERAKAEKKAERELNADPNSVTSLKKIWRFSKLENGTLEITCYKGDRTEVIVPEKIGKDTVTAIGVGAFTGEPYCAVRTPAAVCERRAEITKITLPETITYIDKHTFCGLPRLAEINIPKSVLEILFQAFFECKALKEIKLSGGITFIGRDAFAGCPNLTVVLHRGSYAERYCKENNIKFKYTDKE